MPENVDRAGIPAPRALVQLRRLVRMRTKTGNGVVVASICHDQFLLSLLATGSTEGLCRPPKRLPSSSPSRLQHLRPGGRHGTQPAKCKTRRQAFQLASMAVLVPLESLPYR